MVTKFNQKKYFENEIYNKVNELKLLCNAAKIPMFFACATVSTDKKTTYETEYVGTESNDIHLKDDKITEFINVVNGFETIPPRNIVEIEFE